MTAILIGTKGSATPPQEIARVLGITLGMTVHKTEIQISTGITWFAKTAGDTILLNIGQVYIDTVFALLDGRVLIAHCV